MCGICGVFAFEKVAEPGPLLAAVQGMTNLMVRRGPDDEGFWTDTRCALGFRRLAILDLSPTGRQPMVTADSRYVLAFNGEVYNFPDIRAQLEARGTRFRSTGDAEVVLYAMAEWGTTALSRFNGMFALAFYDALDKKLILARDHAGIKPVYYMHTQQGVAFGSQYNQLLHHPWAQSLSVSSEALSLYLRFGYIPAPYAMLEKTHLLEAGCWQSFDSQGRMEQGRFFEFPQFSHVTLHGEEAVDALDEALSGAVARHLISDVPMGVLLSGGIDSPLVAAEACRRSTRKLKAFSIGVQNDDADESVAASRYAREMQLEHFVRMADPVSAIDLLDDVIEACSEPTADFSIFPTLMVARLAHEHVKVALSGDGGDELFWGYPSRFGSVIEQAEYFGLPRPFRLGYLAVRRYFKHGRATRDVLWPSIGRLYRKKHTLMSEADLASCFPDLPPLPPAFSLFEYWGSDPQETAQWVRWNEFRLHLARVLLKVDRASMYHSLEVRVPLLDKQVVAVALQTDWQSCLDLPERQGKITLRQVLSRRLNYQTQAKKGFTVPMHLWLAGPLQYMLKEKVLGCSDLLGLEVNQAHLREMNQELLNGNRYVAWGLWLLLSLALWQERHLTSRQAALQGAELGLTKQCA